MGIDDALSMDDGMRLVRFKDQLRQRPEMAIADQVSIPPRRCLTCPAPLAGPRFLVCADCAPTLLSLDGQDAAVLTTAGDMLTDLLDVLCPDQDQPLGRDRGYIFRSLTTTIALIRDLLDAD